MSRPTLRLFDGFDHTTPHLKDEVKELQNLLRNHNYSVQADGEFGWNTERAVKLFQMDHGLDDDGIVGEKTWNALLGEEETVGGPAAPPPTTGFSTTYSKNNSTMLKQLNEANKYKAFIDEAAQKYGFQQSIIAGIGSRESHWGLALTPPNPGGTGDFHKRGGKLPPDGGGYGRGLMQIDYGFHEFAQTGNWKDARSNILYGAKVLAGSHSFLERKTNLSGHDLLRGALAGYNCGPGNVLRAVRDGRDVDFYTTGRDYSKDVLNRAGFFQLHGWT